MRRTLQSAPTAVNCCCISHYGQKMTRIQGVLEFRKFRIRFKSHSNRQTWTVCSIDAVKQNHFKCSGNTNPSKRIYFNQNISVLANFCVSNIITWQRWCRQNWWSWYSYRWTWVSHGSWIIRRIESWCEDQLLVRHDPRSIMTATLLIWTRFFYPMLYSGLRRCKL